MNLRSEFQHYFTSEKLVKTTSTITVVTGFMVILGWAFDVDLLKGIRPNWVTMKVNTAICMILCGASLYCATSSKEKWVLASKILAGCSGVIAALSFSETLFGINLGIDQFFFYEGASAVKTAYPGRMASNTALCFMLLSSSIAWLSKKNLSQIYIPQLLSLAATAIASLTLVGYFYQSNSLLEAFAYSTMALHTSLCLVLLSIGTLALHPHQGMLRTVVWNPQAPGTGYRFFLMSALAPIALGWFIQKGELSGYYPASLSFVLFAILSCVFLATITWWNLRTIHQVTQERMKTDEELRDANANLKLWVEDRTYELKTALARLMASERQFRSVAHSATDAIISTDPKGNIISWNLGAEKIFGTPEAEAMGRPVTLIMPERYRELHAQGLKNLQSGSAPKVIGKLVELVGLKKDGTEFPIELSLSTWVVNGENCYSGIVRDISDRKAVQRILNEQQQAVIQLSKMKAIGEISGGIAHEINTPLATICLQTSQIKTWIDSGELEQAKNYTDQIEATAFRIAKIIQGLRAFAKDFDDSPLFLASLDSIFETTLSLCQGRFKKKGVDLYMTPIPQSLRIECRSGEISQALLNLLNNAFEAVATVENKWIRIEIIERSAVVEIQIVDSGIGIKPEIQDKIMQPFFTTKEIGQNTGLGLSVAKGIVENHHGELFLDKSSAATRFIVILPKTQPISGSQAAA